MIARVMRLLMISVMGLSLWVLLLWGEAGVFISISNMGFWVVFGGIFGV